jgi:HEAT repeat protein
VQLLGIRPSLWVMTIGCVAGVLCLGRIRWGSRFPDKPRVIEAARVLDSRPKVAASPRFLSYAPDSSADDTSPEMTSLAADLADCMAEVRGSAASALGELGFGAIEAVPALKSIARNDPDAEVRKRAMEALYNIRGPNGSAWTDL